MTISSRITDALNAVLTNTWAVELPPEPTFPAFVFEVNTATEANWSPAEVYSQHEITVFIYVESKQQIATYRPQIVTAIETINDAGFRYFGEEESGDAGFEDFPGVYAYFINFRIRERNA